MTSNKTHINDLHAEHKAWLEESSFYEDELKVFRERLAEVAGKNTKPEITSEVEHFQNQFIIQKEQLDELNHEATVHEQALAKFAEKHPVAIEHRLFDNHDALIGKITAFKKLYEEMKEGFNKFLSGAM